MPRVTIGGSDVFGLEALFGDDLLTASVRELADLLLPGELDAYASADLHGSDLSRQEFASFDFSGANLADADLSESNFQAASFDSADLTGSNLDSANLTAATFRGAKLAPSSANSANFAGAEWSTASEINDVAMMAIQQTGGDVEPSILRRRNREAFCERIRRVRRLTDALFEHIARQSMSAYSTLPPSERDLWNLYKWLGVGEVLLKLERGSTSELRRFPVALDVDGKSLLESMNDLAHLFERRSQLFLRRGDFITELRSAARAAKWAGVEGELRLDAYQADVDADPGPDLIDASTRLADTLEFWLSQREDMAGR